MSSFYTSARAYGGSILYRGYDKNSKPICKKIQYNPFYYTLDEMCIENSTDYITFDTNKPLKKITCESIKDFNEKTRLLSSANSEIYGTTNIAAQLISFLYKDELLPNTKIIKKAIVDIEVDSRFGFPDSYKAEQQITAISYKIIDDKRLYVWTNNNFGVFDSKNIKYISKEDQNKIELIHFSCNTEEELLSSFIDIFSGNYPDIITGWNSRYYDVPYLYNRIVKLLSKKQVNRLSPFNIIKEIKTKEMFYGEEQIKSTYDIYGISELDYMDLYKKYTYVPEISYSLDNIAEKVLGVGKLHYGGTITDMLLGDYQKYCEYNIIDVLRIEDIEHEIQFLELIISISYKAKVPSFTDSLGTVRYWEILIYSYLLSQGKQPKIVKKIIDEENDTPYIGGYVKDPIKGKHDWIVSFDLASLYPSIIRQVNIGSETLLPYTVDLSDIDVINKREDIESILKTYGDYSVAANGVLYRKDEQSFLSELMEKFFNERKIYKKKMFEKEKEFLEIEKELKNNKNNIDEILMNIKKVANEKKIFNIKQMAIKILINSVYGAIGNKYFQYYDIRNAIAITLTGQTITRWAERKVNEYLNNLLETKNVDYIIIIDTDSIYVNLDPIVKKMFGSKIDLESELSKDDTLKIVEFLDKFCKEKIEKHIGYGYEEYFQYMNHKENVMNMEREIISDKTIVQSKKHYAMSYWDKEGVRYSSPQYKIMGLEVVKSSTPKWLKGKLKIAMEIMLRKEEKVLVDFIKETKKEFYKLEPEQIAKPSSTNEIYKWIEGNNKNQFKSGCPIHVRGSLIYNNIINSLQLTKKYDIIKEGDRIFFAYLKLPNPTGNNVISWPGDKLPKELNIHKYIDYETQFEKLFLKPIQGITDVIDWKTEYLNVDVCEYF